MLRARRPCGCGCAPMGGRRLCWRCCISFSATRVFLCRWTMCWSHRCFSRRRVSRWPWRCGSGRRCGRGCLPVSSSLHSRAGWPRGPRSPLPQSTASRLCSRCFFSARSNWTRPCRARAIWPDCCWWSFSSCSRSAPLSAMPRSGPGASSNAPICRPHGSTGGSATRSAKCSSPRCCSQFLRTGGVGWKEQAISS